MTTTTFTTTEDGCVQVTVVKDNFTEIGWVSSMHLAYTKEQQLIRVIERKAAAIFAEISDLENEAMSPIHDA